MVVKSLVVGPAHASFPNRGGLHHYYANDKAVAGYRTGTFPDGAIVVDEAVFTKEGEGRATGLLLEGERRFLDVMVKDAERYKSTGGWGYEHFDRDDQTGRLTDAERGTVRHLSREGAGGSRLQSDQTVRPYARRAREHCAVVTRAQGTSTMTGACTIDAAPANGVVGFAPVDPAVNRS